MSKIIGAHIPAQTKNYAINGSFDFFQEREGNATIINTTGSNAYWADQWKEFSGGTTNKSFNHIQSADVPSFAQSGFTSRYSGMFTMTTGIVSFAAGDYVQPFEHILEGLDYSKLHGKPVTFGFWAKASVAGTYSFAMRNAAVNRSYVTSFTIGANNWEFKSITVTMDNTGTWVFDNNLALYIEIGSYAGTNFQTGVTGSWQTGNVFVPTGATNWMATSGATLRIAQFSIVEGALGLGATGYVRAGMTYEEELMLCQRYYEKSMQQGLSIGNATSVGCATNLTGANGEGRCTVFFKTVKRNASPSINYYSTATAALGNVRNNTNGTDLVCSAIGIGDSAYSLTAGTLSSQWLTWQWTADARM